MSKIVKFTLVDMAVPAIFSADKKLFKAFFFIRIL
jgi:hypothetical protein